MAELLIVDDDRDHIELLTVRLKRTGHNVSHATDETSFRELAGRCDLVLADYTMPRFGALRAMAVMREIGADAPVIVVSGTIGEERAIEVMKQGAVDYLLKDHLGRLEQAISQALERFNLHRSLYIDRATRLPTVAALYDAMANGEFEQGAIAVVGIVNQVDINRTFGRATGDEVLQSIGARLSGLGPRVRAYRLPSAKFAAVMEGMSADHAAEALQHQLGNPSQLQRAAGAARHADFYCGIAAFGDDVDAPEALEGARIAFEQGRQRRDRFYVMGEDTDRRRGHLVLVGDLGDAIVRDEIEVYLQPKIRLDDCKLVGAEALARWRHPTHGFVPPDVFVGLAEQHGFIYELTRLVLRKAFRLSSELGIDGHDLPVSVNLSASDLRHPALVDDVASLLTEFDIDPGCVTLEFTETVLMADVAESVAVTERLHALGVRTSVDDFGTGYSSLAYLARLPLHELKIDKSFVKSLSEREADETIVETLIALGQKLGLEVVAEGIEDEPAAQRLREMGCETAQGYLIAKPMSGDDFRAWSAQRAKR